MSKTNTNTVVISGNLIKDSDLRVMPSGSQILEFCVAVSEARKDPSGAWVEYTHFINCVLFGDRGGRIHPYMKKGTHVVVSGKLNYHSWEKDGAKRSSINVVVREVEFRNPSDGKNAIKNAQDTEVAADAYADENIPF